MSQRIVYYYYYYYYYYRKTSTQLDANCMRQMKHMTTRKDSKQGRRQWAFRAALDSQHVLSNMARTTAHSALTQPQVQYASVTERSSARTVYICADGILFRRNPETPGSDVLNGTEITSQTKLKHG